MSETRLIHGKTVDNDPDKWSDDELLWLSQWDMPDLNSDVSAQLEKRSLAVSNAQVQGAPANPQGGLGDYSVKQLVDHIHARRAVDPDAFDEEWSVAMDEAKAASGAESTEYDDRNKDELLEEARARGLEGLSGARKAEIIAALVASDNQE